MAWVKIDDHLDDNEKVAEAGPLGLALYVAGLCYCNRNLTDGRIRKGVARKLQDFSAFKGPQPVIDQLLAVGLWVEDDKGYLIPDYLDFQPSRESVLADREAAKQRAKSNRSSGKRSSEVQTNVQENGSRTSGEPPGEQPANGMANNGRGSGTPGSRFPVPGFPESHSPPPPGGGVDFTKLRDTLVGQFDPIDTEGALSLLRVRLQAGEKISSPVLWASKVASSMAEKRKAAARAEEPKRVVLEDGSALVFADGQWREDELEAQGEAS